MIIRVEKHAISYTVISNEVLQDETLSWKARGLLCYLLSLPDNWSIYAEELAKHATDGITSTSTAIKELIHAGYITKQQLRTEEGKFSNYEYVVRETKTLPNPEKPKSEKPISGNPISGNLKLLNTDLTKYELNKVPIKELSADADTPNSQNEHQQLVEALAEITQMDTKIKSNIGQIVRLAKELRQAGYTSKDVREYAKLWKRDWRYEKDQSPPTLTIIKTEIGKIKSRRQNNGGAKCKNGNYYDEEQRLEEYRKYYTTQKRGKNGN